MRSATSNLQTGKCTNKTHLLLFGSTHIVVCDATHAASNAQTPCSSLHNVVLSLCNALNDISMRIKGFACMHLYDVDVPSDLGQWYSRKGGPPRYSHTWSLDILLYSMLHFVLGQTDTSGDLKHCPLQQSVAAALYSMATEHVGQACHLTM